jgi:hypothetical protein
MMMMVNGCGNAAAVMACKMSAGLSNTARKNLLTAPDSQSTQPVHTTDRTVASVTQQHGEVREASGHWGVE